MILKSKYLSYRCFKENEIKIEKLILIIYRDCLPCILPKNNLNLFFPNFYKNIVNTFVRSFVFVLHSAEVNIIPN
jgi:hypothetical protein